jgi:hypothetical protein
MRTVDRKLALGAALILGALSATAVAGDTGARVDASRAVIKAFMGELQGELQAAMQAGGAVNAIGVCRTQAPQIATKAGSEHGWRVARTSLRPRNPDNAPDAWEAAVLKKFEARKAAGEDPAQIEHSEVVTVKGKKQFRYMKAIAIPQYAPCLQCHGKEIAPEVQAKLKALYPKDQATGYRTGDIRGAFTISQPM